MTTTAVRDTESTAPAALASTGPGTGTPSRSRRAWVRWPIRLLSLVAAVVAWQLLTDADVRLWLRFDKLPSATDVLRAFGAQLESGSYYRDIAASLLRILQGYLLATVFGVVLGIATARSRWASDVLGTLLEVVRPIPAIALVPVAILLLPTSEQGIVFITFLAAFFPVLVGTRHAVRALPTIWEDALRTMGAGRMRVLVSVVLPGALPGIVGGLSTAIGVSWICVISAEMISGQFGIGYRTWQAYTVVDYPGVLVGMLSIGLLGWFTAALVELVGRRLTRWLPRETTGRIR